MVKLPVTGERRIPRSALNHHPVPVRILKRAALLAPVRIERFDLLEASATHRLATFRPRLMIGNIEDKQIFGRWLRRHWVSAADGELKVEIRVAKAQHGSIEAIVVRKVGEFFKAQALLVLGDSAAKIQHGARDSQVNAHNSGRCWSRAHYSHATRRPTCKGCGFFVTETGLMAMPHPSSPTNMQPPISHGSDNARVPDTSTTAAYDASATTLLECAMIRATSAKSSFALTWCPSERVNISSA